MMLQISEFRGSLPRVHETRLAENMASFAENVSFSAATIKPLYGLRDVDVDISLTTKQVFLYRVNDAFYWLQFDNWVKLIYSPIKDDSYNRLYWTEKGLAPQYSIYPEIINFPPYPSTKYNLGVPAPQHIPTISYISAIGEDDETEVRSYLITYVNEIGEESAPSAPSTQVTVSLTGDVTLGNLTVPSQIVLEYKIRKIRVYRTQTGTSSADFRFVAQMDSATQFFVDGVRGNELGEELPSTNWTEPRVDMQGLGLTAYGVAYGFVDRMICLSEPFHVYAFPRDYELTTQYKIVAMGHYDNIIVVGTEGNPVMLTGVDPSGMTVTELPVNESCVSERSMISLAYGVIYASPNGLVLANANGAKLITEGLFDRDNWSELNPSSIHAVEYRGAYLFFYDNGVSKGGFIVNPLNLDLGVVHLDFHCLSTFRDMKEDKIYMLSHDRKLILFDLSDSRQRRSYKWVSKKYRVSNFGTRFLAMRVLANKYEDMTVRIFADGVEIYKKSPNSDLPFRIPDHSRKMYWQIEVSGTDEVLLIQLAETMRELESG